MSHSQLVENPFRLPPDEEVFLMREQRRKEKEEEKVVKSNQKVWEKKTFSGRIVTSKRLRKDEARTLSLKEGTKGGLGEKTSAASSSAKPAVGEEPGGRAPMRENTADFVAKKREMFLVQMALDVKKAEILKLDEKGKAKEQALCKSQQMLDEDVARFDTFLQANDAKAHSAMRRAEEMSKIKQERLSKIKGLRGKIAQIQSEISKYKINVLRH